MYLEVFQRGFACFGWLCSGRMAAAVSPAEAQADVALVPRRRIANPDTAAVLSDNESERTRRFDYATPRRGNPNSSGIHSRNKWIGAKKPLCHLEYDRQPLSLRGFRSESEAEGGSDGGPGWTLHQRGAASRGVGSPSRSRRRRPSSCRAAPRRSSPRASCVCS